MILNFINLINYSKQKNIMKLLKNLLILLKNLIILIMLLIYDYLIHYLICARFFYLFYYVTSKKFFL